MKENIAKFVAVLLLFLGLSSILQVSGIKPGMVRALPVESSAQESEQAEKNFLSGAAAPSALQSFSGFPSTPDLIHCYFSSKLDDAPILAGRSLFLLFSSFLI